MPDSTNIDSISSAALDSVPGHIAILDPEGTITMVNAPWRRYAELNGMIGGGYGVGSNYINVCEHAVGDCSKESAMVAAGIRSVLDGSIPSFELEYPCHSPTEKQWFRIMVNSLGGKANAGAVVTHVDITERKLAELAQKDLNHDLAERIKEIRGLHKVSDLLRNDSSEIDPLLDQIAAVLPSTVQHPEIAAGRVCVNKVEAVTSNYQSSENSLRSDFTLADGSSGFLEIVYLVDSSDKEAVFVPEEKQMLDSMAENMRATIDSRTAKEKLKETNERFKRQLDELTKLSGSGILANKSINETLRLITECVSQTLNVERVSIWSLTQDRTKIIADDLYLATGGKHESGLELCETDFPAYFNAVNENKLIVANEALTDEVTKDFAESYLKPLGIFSMLDAPVVVEGNVAGVICLENVGQGRIWASDEQSFALSVANLVSLALAREARRLSEASLAKAQEIAHLGSWNLDLKTNRLSWSDETYRIFGLRPNEFATSFEAFINTVHPDDRAEMLNAQERTLDGTAKLDIEHRIVLPGGEIRWVHELGEIVKNGAGDPVKLTGTVLDITPRKAAESDILKRSHELKQANEQLSTSQSLLQIAGRAAKLGGWTRKLPEMEITWSDEACIIHDVPPGYKPKLAEAIEFHAPECRDKIAELVEECKTNGTPYDVEVQKTTALGRSIWVRTMGSAVRDESGTIVGLQGAFQDITDQKKAEQSLAESQRRFRQLAESMPIVVWTASPSGSLNFANRSFYEYLGIPSSSVPSAWFGAVLPEDREIVASEWYRTVEAGSNYSVEYRVRRGSDGMYRWFRVQAQPIKDSSGEITTWYGTAIDIHETKELEQNATQIANRLSATLESITDGFYAVDKDWRFTYVNSPAEAMIVRSRAELIGKILWEEYPDAVGTHTETNYRRAVAEGVPVEFESYFPPLESWFEIKAYPSDEGLSVYFRDVTAIREHRELMRESEERFQLLAKATNDAIWDWNLTTNALWWNDGFEKLFGFDRDEVEPNIESWTNRIHLDDSEQVIAEIHKAIDDGDDWWSGEYRFGKSDGSYAFVLDRGYVIHDSAGVPIRMIGGMTDLTDRKNLEEQLLQSQKMEAIGQLAGGVAHDFNNLLTVINGYSEMLLRRDFGDEKAKTALTGINDAGKRAEALTRQLLAFSRRQPLNPTVVNLNELLGSLWKMTGRLIGDHIELDARLPDGISNVKVDPGQYEQVLINLAVNARDAMPNGGHLLIETRNTTLDKKYCEQHPEVVPGRYVVTSVSDTGIGMSEEVKSRIFEPFFTTKLVGKGTGLGLATVFGIVKQSGGHIAVYSEPGHGTTFNIYLPAASAGFKEVADKDIHQSDTPQGNEIVLLVEDSPPVRSMLKEALVDCGYRVFEANDGRHALEVIESLTEKPNIVISDEVMPRMRGHELAANIKVLHPDCKVLLMSGYTEDSVLRRGILDADLAFLQKPFTPAALARKVREVLDN